MQAYAVIAKVNADFADHEWGKKNLKEEGLADDFSTVWARSGSYLDLKDYDDGVYFYGGRGAIYKALAKFEDSAIRSMIVGLIGRMGYMSSARWSKSITARRSRSSCSRLPMPSATRTWLLFAIRNSKKG